MKLPLSARLSLSYLAVICVGMSIAASLAWLVVERLYVSTQEANLLAQAQLLAATVKITEPTEDSIERSIGAPASQVIPPPYSQTSNLLPGIHTRLIDQKGAVIIDLANAGSISDTGGINLPQLAQNAAGRVSPDELLSRPEISSALAGQPATAIRRVKTDEERRVLYAAAPVPSVDGGVSQIVYLASPLPDTSWAALPGRLRGELAGVILLAMVLAWLAGLLLASRISTPLKQLSIVAQGVAAGDLDKIVPVDQEIDELHVLGESFNSMTASLRQARQIKNSFVANVTHELRTPLTVIKGTIETLQDGAMDDPSAREVFLGSMNRETERLIRLVNDLLVLARSDVGALNLQLIRLEIGELARERCKYLAHKASEAQVKLAVKMRSPEEECIVLGDADRLAQVLDNLLDNAIRHSPQSGEVTVTLERLEDQVACWVTDSGPGIPPQHLSRIFERFYRVDPARSRDRGGSGLGLSIVESLVSAHGGRVFAQSEIDQGTAISFWLPVAKD